ncbi:MAG TPA: shikimate kinase, partial [Thermoanaerobaculia bacterium]|nr:shikimate kinase [Thermoanaerobaculia bacterium]
GMSVRQIFETHGEAAFRQLEQEVLRETVELPEGVVATGGGTFAYESNARLMQAHGRTVFLNPTFSTIVARIGRGKLDRPLFRDDVQALNLYRERLPAYRRADVTVDVAAAESAGEVASRIALLLGAKPCAT